MNTTHLKLITTNLRLICNQLEEIFSTKESQDKEYTPRPNQSSRIGQYQSRVFDRTKEKSFLKWSDSDTKIMVRAKAEGKSDKEVGDLLGRSADAIMARMAKLRKNKTLDNFK